MSCVCFLISALFINALFSISKSDIETKYISQPLDHFSNDSTHFDMKYMERLRFWKPNGPILVYISGEYLAKDRYLKRSGMVRMARETNGAIFLIEHRFYGTSRPLEKRGEKNYRYLNIKQALADVAHFITTIKMDERFTKSKVVVIGVSYSGNLAAWMRQNYPKLVDAAWSSSAPVLAKVDFFEYYENLGDIYRKYGGKSCYKNIEKVFAHQLQLLDSLNLEQLKEENNICQEVDLSKPIQKQLYFDSFIGIFDQNRKPNQVNKVCDMVRNITNSKQLRHLGSQNVKHECNPVTFEYILPRNSDDVAWAWQSCSELGLFITTSSNKQPFGNTIPLEFPIKKCKMFGAHFNENINKSIDNTNKVYGGLTPNVTKVVFVNGALDPWHHLGIIQDVSSEAPAIFLRDQGHGDDFKPTKPGDSKELKEAKNKIMRIIKKWIS